jgi:hypothetical protein
MQIVDLSMGTTVPGRGISPYEASIKVGIFLAQCAKIPARWSGPPPLLKLEAAPASEQGKIGPDLFRKACEIGLEGLVSKHRDRSKHWVKVNNRKHPAMNRVMDALGL